ncbi:unnamed protein product [Didymodactylos carnosus]|uniref:Uncharacterized protein n=2 Tax=Didymodactylos carnosus TaxID=1234261 RepID=A0A813XKW4_9BILA|nr:unnamed protein product [Didymodactylos carnosus]CAF3658703.1 unnamed protein product [Didymodactylos carnosus]
MLFVMFFLIHLYPVNSLYCKLPCEYELDINGTTFNDKINCHDLTDQYSQCIVQIIFKYGLVQGLTPIPPSIKIQYISNTKTPNEPSNINIYHQLQTHVEFTDTDDNNAMLTTITINFACKDGDKCDENYVKSMLPISLNNEKTYKSFKVNISRTIFLAENYFENDNIRCYTFSSKRPSQSEMSNLSRVVFNNNQPPETIIANPSETTTVKPSETTTTDPSETTTADPSETTTANPSETSTANPSETSTANPSETTTANPSETTTADPSETTTADPSETTTADPSETSTVKPSETTTANPSETTTANPSETSTAKPSETTTANPLETTTVKPSETMTANPSETSTAKPSETTTANPLETTPVKPSETTTANPSETSTAKPSETTTVKPSETTATESSINTTAETTTNYVVTSAK